MKPQIKVIPIDHKISPEMADDVKGFLSANGLSPDVMDKAWTVYETDGECYRVLGFAGVNLGSRMADVPVYHVIDPVSGRDEWLAMKAHEKLFERITGFVADALGNGTQVFFHIAPESQDKWKAFQQKVKGHNAHRFVMEV